MGHAWKPPETSREFHFHISKHAVERFRERVDEEHCSSSNRDLAMLLDQRLWDALRSSPPHSEVIEDSEAPDEVTHLVRIESRTGVNQFVVMRKMRLSQYPRMPMIAGPTGAALCAITLLTADMATNNFNNGKWRRPVKPLTQPLAEKLQAVKLPSATIPAADVPPPPAETEAEVKSRGSTVERISFARDILRRRPSISAQGADGLSELVRAEFGVGMSNAMIADIRRQMEAEDAANAAASRAPRTSIAAPRETWVSAPAPAPPPPAPPSLGERLAAAIEAERVAVTALDDVQRRVEEALARAPEVRATASAAVEALMAEVQGLRSGANNQRVAQG